MPTTRTPLRRLRRAPGASSLLARLAILVERSCGEFADHVRPDRRDRTHLANFARVLTELMAGNPLAIGMDMSNTSPSRNGQTFAIIGAAMEVHRVLGPGYLEAYFREALQIEFSLRAIPFKGEVPCLVEYKGHLLSGTHRVDFVCFDAVVVEVKAKSIVGPAEHAQVLNYLAATKLECGLLLNFGGRSLDYRRFILSRDKPARTNQ